MPPCGRRGDVMGTQPSQPQQPQQQQRLSTGSRRSAAVMSVTVRRGASATATAVSCRLRAGLNDEALIL